MLDLSGVNPDKKLKKSEDTEDTEFKLFSEFLINFLTPRIDESKYTSEELKIIKNVPHGIAIAHCYSPQEILEMVKLYEKLKNKRTDNNEGKEEAILRHQLNMPCPEDTNPYKDNDRTKIENIGSKIRLYEYCSYIDSILPMND